MLAVAHALQCTSDSDVDHCFKTYRYDFPGQNSIVIPSSYGASKAVEETIDKWFSEYESVTNENWLSKFGSSDAPLNRIGHFTQMIQDDASAIGCGIVENQRFFHITCNYAVNNKNGSDIFQVGPVARDCQKKHREYSNLCNANEYEQNYNHREQHQPQSVKNWIQNGKKINLKDNEREHDENHDKDEENNQNKDKHNKQNDKDNSAGCNNGFNPTLILSLISIVAKICTL